MGVLSLRSEDCLLQVHGGDSYFRFHEDIKTLGLSFFFLRENFMCIIYVSVTVSLWSPSIYTRQQDFTQYHLVLRKQSCHAQLQALQLRSWQS